MRTAGDTVSIDSIIDPLNRKLCFQRNKSSLKTDIFKKGFVDFNGIKGSISKKSFWISKDVSGKNQSKPGSVLSNPQEIYPHPENLISFLQRYQDGI